jgi:hypothetical protein
MEINTPSGSFIAFMILFFLFYIGIMALMIISMWKIFVKANKPGWAAIVPFYNSYVMVEIAKKPTWWFGMMFVPLANFVFIIMIINGMVKSFGKSEGFTVGVIFLPYVFFPILAFGDAKYIDSEKFSSQNLPDN